MRPVSKGWPFGFNMNYKDLIDISSAALTPVVAVITLYIAIQQFRSGKAKYRHDLYEKRLAVYKSTMRFMMYASMSFPIDDKLDNYLLAISEARFLFDKGLSDYLQELYLKGLTKKMLEDRRKRVPLEDEHNIVLEIRDLERWFDDRKNPAHEQFVKYLDLKNLK